MRLGQHSLLHQCSRLSWASSLPAFQVSPEDKVKISPKKVPLVKAIQEKFPDHTPPAWLTLTAETEGKMAAVPKREEIDTILEDHLVVEYYSR